MLRLTTAPRLSLRPSATSSTRYWCATPALVAAGLLIVALGSCGQSGTKTRVDNGEGKTKIDALSHTVIQTFTNNTGRAWTLDTVSPHIAFGGAQATATVQVVDSLSASANVLASDTRSSILGYGHWKKLWPLDGLGKRLSVAAGATVFLRFRTAGDSLIMKRSNSDKLSGTLYIDGIAAPGDLKLRVTSTESF